MAIADGPRRRQLAKNYGGVSEDADDKGKAAYKALLAAGSSGFNALLGGGLSDDGQYTDWKPTDSTGRHQRVTWPVDGSTTLVEAGNLSIVKAVARSREHCPLGVSESDDSNPGLIPFDSRFDVSIMELAEKVFAEGRE